MKNKILFTLLICLTSIYGAFSQNAKISIDLPKEWKFHTGDNPEFSKPGFDDRAWKTIFVDNFWENQGYTNYDGIAWYRTQIVIPSSLKGNNAVLQALNIALGRIDDGDETYLNGKKIGGLSDWSKDRNYLIPSNLIEWDKENCIAIRVTDNAGNGGMYGKPHSIRNVALSDIVILKAKDKPTEFKSPDSRFNKTLLFGFKLPVDRIEGTIQVKVYNSKSKEVVFQKEDSIVVGNKADSVYKLEFIVKKPDTYKIDYWFTAKSLPDTLKYSTLFAYTITPRENEHVEYPVIKQMIPNRENSFDLENIVFEGYLNDRLNANLTQRLLNIDETGILECYYNRPGNQTWVGEYTGKYLHAASRVWRSTNNPHLKAQMDRIVDILIGCQNEDGYLGTYLPADYWTEWDVWAHKYNLLGLLSYYSATSYKPALEASVKMGDLLCRTFGESKGQRNIIESSGHMGMASTSVLEPMTDLYRFTGNKKYLDFCNYIIKAYDYENGPKIISTLTTIGKVDKTANGKAYEMMSNFTGIVKLYQLTGNEKLLKAAENAWSDIATKKLYITGTASKGEHFQEDFVLPAENDDNMGEGCVTTTWLQFSQALFNLTGQAKYLDEIEKSVYNHLLAAENPETGCVSYYTALQGKKPYRCTINGHCCLASVPRGIAAIPELAYTRNADNGLSLNLYSAGKLKNKISTINGKEVYVECTIDSKFPEEGRATITLNPEVKSNFRLALRVPAWSKNFKAYVDGKTYNGVAGQYLNIDKVWNTHAIIKVSFDLNIQILDGAKSYPGYIALKIGPQVLAVDQSLNPGISDLDKLSFDTPKVSALSKTLLPKEWIGSQIFNANAYYDGKPINLKLVPFADAGQKDSEIRVWIKKK